MTTTPEQGFNARDTSEVPTKWKPGEIVIRDGNVLSFIEAEIEGEKWEILGMLAPYVHPDHARRAETTPAGDAGKLADNVHPIERLWRELGLPEYFLGNGGTNTKLYALYDRLRAAPQTDHEANAVGWHKCAEGLMTMASLSSAGSPAEMLSQFQNWLASRTAPQSPTADDMAFISRMKKTPIKDIDRADRCAMIDLLHKLTTPLPSVQGGE